MKTIPEISTEKCDTESAIAAKTRIVDDQRSHSTSLELRKSTNAGSPTLSINLFTIVMLIITLQLN